MTHTAHAAVLQHLRFSTRSDGDFHRDHVDPVELERTRRRFVDLPWTLPDEIHGAQVVVVTSPGEHDGVRADALVTATTDAVLGIWVGDCAPVALLGDTGVIGAVHAGWRGLGGGTIEAAVTAMRMLGAGGIRAVLGPCIHPCCYEFGPDDLERFTARHGEAVHGFTRTGRSALDVPAVVSAICAGLEIPLDRFGGCTGCSSQRYFSHRVRGELGRQVMAVWQAVAA